MPCDSSYMEPHSHERESARIGKHLKRIHENTSWDIGRNLWDVNPTYGNTDVLDLQVSALCFTLKSMSEAELNRWVYNGKDKDARDLANWWEEHQEADKKKGKKMKKIEVKTGFPSNDPEFIGDYYEMHVAVDGEVVVKYGDSYHDKGQEKAEGFVDALVWAGLTDDDHVTHTEFLLDYY